MPGRGLAAERGLDRGLHVFAVGAPGHLGHGGLHGLAHVLGTRGAALADRLLDQRDQGRSVEALGQETLDDGELEALLVDEILAAALLVLLDGLLRCLAIFLRTSRTTSSAASISPPPPAVGPSVRVLMTLFFTSVRMDESTSFLGSRFFIASFQAAPMSL